MNRTALYIIGFGILSVVLIILGNQSDNITDEILFNSATLDTEHLGNKKLKTAPDFIAETLSGEKIILSDYRNNKPVILDFWASWCPNCRRDLPIMNKLYNTHSANVEMIGINLQENNRTVSNYIEDARITFPIVLDSNGQISSQFNVRYTNTHILINKNGEIVDVISGDLKEAHVQKLLAS